MLNRSVVPYFLRNTKRRKRKLKESKITGRTYNEVDGVYISNMLQCHKYLNYLGPEYLLDILYTDTKKKDALVFVFKKCPETRKAKELWDNHELN
jgi:hypothetical protein